MSEINEYSTDEQIVKKVIKGEVRLFKHIVDRYENKIFSIGMRLFKNYDDSYDFTQEVFLKTFEKIDMYRNKGQFRFWLTKLAYNHGINKLGSIKKDVSLNNEILDEKSITPDKLHLKNEIKDILAAEINRLPEKYRICLDFYFFMGLSYREINEITHIPVNTIKSNVFRAKDVLLKRLKGTIAEDYNEM